MCVCIYIYIYTSTLSFKDLGSAGEIHTFYSAEMQ